MEENRICITVEEMGKQLGISRPTAYQLANSEGFPAIRIGRRLVIPVTAFEKWLMERASAGNVLPE